MKKIRTMWCIRLAIMALPALSILNLQEALAESKPDEIVAMDLLTVKEPGSQAESRLRVIRLTTRSGATGYGDYLDYGLPAENAEETLARLANRYAEQNHKKDIFLTDPSMRALLAVGPVAVAFGPCLLTIRPPVAVLTVMTAAGDEHALNLFLVGRRLACGLRIHRHHVD